MRLICAGRAAAAIALGVLAVLTAGCDRPAASTAEKNAETKVPPGPNVTVSQPVQRTIVEWDEYTGRFDAVETVDVRARVSGYLTEVHFKDGQRVTKGDLLYVIDARPFERTVEQARAELAQASTKSENSTLDVERGKPLLERRIMSEKTFDDRANLLREAQAAVKVAEAKLKTAELDLSFTRITSPLTGRISLSQVSVGNWVSAGGTANVTLLTTIVSEDPIQIYFDVSENNYIKYKRMAERGDGAGAADIGAAIEVGLPDEHGFPHKGRLDFLDNRLDQGTGTLRARGLLPNAAGLFSPNLFGRVRVTGSPAYAAVLIPDEAIGTDQTNKFVYTVGEDGLVARRNITPGPLSEGLRVVRQGLAADDWVITRGLNRARPGQTVVAKREAIAASVVPAAAATSPKAQR